jgi:hypothetical protein
MRDKTNTAISKQLCTSYFNFGFCSERLARLNSTACLQFLCSHHSTINPGRGYHNHHHQHFLWKVSSFLCTHLPFLINVIIAYTQMCVCNLFHSPSSSSSDTQSTWHITHVSHMSFPALKNVLWICELSYCTNEGRKVHTARQTQTILQN